MKSEKALCVYNSLDPQSVAAAALAKLLYSDCTLKDILGIATGNITTWIGTLTAVYDVILIAYTVTTAGTGVISPAQQILLDAKCARSVVKTGTATESASDDSLTAAALGAGVDDYKNMYLKTTGGTGLNQVRKILANSTTVITLESAWTTPIANDTTFAICAGRDDFSHYVETTSGQKKRAILAWEHTKLFNGIPEPLWIHKLAGDKTTADTATNAQSVLDEGYIIPATKYFLRNLADQAVLQAWGRLLFGEPVPNPDNTKIKQPPMDVALYREYYAFGKLLKESATALSVSL